MIGQNGWLECTEQSDLNKNKHTPQKKTGILDGIRKIAKDMSGLHQSRRTLPAARRSVGTHAAVSLDPREQSLLYCELEFNLTTAINMYISEELDKGHLSPDHLKRVSDEWHQKGHHKVVGFRYDLETQLELVSLHINDFSFYGRRQGNTTEIALLLNEMKTNARNMRVRTFCQPDTTVAKHLVDSQSLFNLINASASQQIALAEIARFFNDVLPWQCHARQLASNDVRFVDVDYPDLMHKKRAVVLQTPELRKLLGDDYTMSDKGKDGLLLRSATYCQLGCDLRQLGRLRTLLESVVSLSECAILFVAEVSITYMDTQYADALIEWGSTVGRENDFCLLEQIIPYGKGHPFAQQMLSHFVKLNTPLRSIEQYPSIDSQVNRFRERGWHRVDIKDLWQTWSSDQFLSDSERMALDDVEPFDEWEEFILFARHYFILHASTEPGAGSFPQTTGPVTSEPPRQFGGLRAERSDGITKDSSRRRFGNNMPAISFRPMATSPSDSRLISSFGAQVVQLGPHAMICGGMGADACLHGQTLTIVTPSAEGLEVKDFSTPGNGECIYRIQLPDTIMDAIHSASRLNSSSGSSIDLVGSRKFVAVSASAGSDVSDNLDQDGRRVSLTHVPTIQLESAEQFRAIVREGKPVILKSCNIGKCQRNWTPEYLVSQIGADEKFVIHESHEDSGALDFNSKNFRYVTDSFGSIMGKLQTGSRVYLRALSRDKPTEVPAKLEEDFPNLAEDFVLPPEMAYIKDHLFSSVLRLSGRVNMWLHYDVMANVYAQVAGTRKMILFPPSDVKHLSFAPGASSSSVNVFQALETSPSSLQATHPQEAVLHPGDVLLLPALWLHTAAPVSDMSVAVNVFFRDPGQQEHYSSGRDVYGNKDFEVYERGRQAVGRIAKSLQSLPPAAREFYLCRLQEELRLATEA
ncbi:hypothetical protein MKX07_000979 [Trichoderma sp. CBMAI-0711]|nr:hypothetical protein MKX07_000979 [Trichoderma sp. CBMAI-0711]